MSKKLYVVATYYKVPKYPSKTSQKDYSKDDNNWAFNENVEIARVIKNRDLAQANIILNLTDKRVEKCNMRPDASYDDLYRYFKNNYPQYFQYVDAVEVKPDAEPAVADAQVVENKEETAAPTA